MVNSTRNTRASRRLTVCPLLSWNRSLCLQMPETQPGCLLMAGRDRRSSMETGETHSLALSPGTSLDKFVSPHFRIRINFLSVCLPTASRSLRPVIQCHRSVVTTWSTTGSRAWPSVCTGTSARGRRAWPKSQTHRTLRTKWVGAGSGTGLS